MGRGWKDPEPRTFPGWVMSGRRDQRGIELPPKEAATEYQRGSETPRATGAEAPLGGFPQDVGRGAGWVVAGDPGVRRPPVPGPDLPLPSRMWPSLQTLP